MREELVNKALAIGKKVREAVGDDITSLLNEYSCEDTCKVITGIVIDFAGTLLGVGSGFFSHDEGERQMFLVDNLPSVFQAIRGLAMVTIEHTPRESPHERLKKKLGELVEKMPAGPQKDRMTDLLAKGFG